MHDQMYSKWCKEPKNRQLPFLLKFLQVKAVVQNREAAQRENVVLMAENVPLRLAILKKSCFTCSGAMVLAELPDENQRLLMENGRLRSKYRQHTHITRTEHCTHTFHTVHTHTYRCRGLSPMARDGAI
jgi:chaperone required for assembly of F1-ATPase